jgi:aminopeptidase N
VSRSTAHGETFYSRIKQWAYTSDQEATTHAIELPVSTTSEAFSNFDGITYGKGASVLKQLPHYLGEENFRRGVARYLRKHAYSNTTLDDFIGELGRAADKDLTNWTRQWLFETGLNTLQARFNCSADGKWLSQLRLEQSAPAEYPTLREQTIQIGLFTIDQLTNQAVTQAIIPVTYTGASTAVPFAANTPCPDLIYPNLDDWGYVKVILDNESHTTLMQHMAAFKDDGLRLMLWETLWEAVQDTRLPLSTYSNFAPKLLAAETNSKIIERVANTLSWSYEYFTLLTNTEQDYNDQRRRIENFFAQEILTRTNETDRQKLFFQQFIASAHTEARLGYLRALLLKQEVVSGLTLDQDLRWQILLRLNQFDYRDYVTLTEVETKADTSQRGIQSALAADAIRPNAVVKQIWLDQIFARDSHYSLDQIRTVMQHLFPVEQSGLRAQFSEQIITRSSALDSATDDQTMKNISTYLAPNTCTQASAAQLAAVKDTLAELRPILGKNYRIAHHNNLRCLRVGELLLKQ